eukprot:sb/3475768/
MRHCTNYTIFRTHKRETNPSLPAQEALERTPAEDIPFVVGSLPSHYVPPLLNFLVELVTSTTHLQFYVLWVSELLNRHGAAVKTHTSTLNGDPFPDILVRLRSEGYESNKDIRPRPSSHCTAL